MRLRALFFLHVNVPPAFKNGDQRWGKTDQGEKSLGRLLCSLEGQSDLNNGCDRRLLLLINHVSVGFAAKRQARNLQKVPRSIPIRPCHIPGHRQVPRSNGINSNSTTHRERGSHDGSRGRVAAEAAHAQAIVARATGTPGEAEGGHAAVDAENAAVAAAASMHPPPRQLTLDGGPLVPDATASSSASDVSSSVAGSTLATPGAMVHFCGHCQKRFRSPARLAQHERVHTTASDVGCQNTATRHARAQTGEKLYACSMCPRRFAKKSDVPRHERTHTLIGPTRKLKGSCGRGHLLALAAPHPISSRLRTNMANVPSSFSMSDEQVVPNFLFHFFFLTKLPSLKKAWAQPLLFLV